MSTWSTASNGGPKDSVSNFSSTRRKPSLCQTGHSTSNCSENVRNVNGPRTTSLPKALAIAMAFAAGVLCNPTTAFHVPNFLSLPCIPSQLPLSRTPAVWGGHEVRGGHSLALYPPLVGPAVPTGVRSLTLFSLPVPGCLS
ncbi:hypothetical protein Naga_100927g2 [Nannochloropsis gaditana]|uniref:Uncharacterized protein n=1 Tax=Nannochloropsis gaditana TaxID=72520 RepID=W7TCH4_9STRA|nr:hypothetical protein Naga_100927g2 [Nannochloropsis gaditana]